MRICDSTPEENVIAQIADLDESQAGEGRHKCAARAYKQGYWNSQAKRARTEDGQ